MSHNEKTILSWLVFVLIVVFLLILDLGFFHKKDHKVSVKESLRMSSFYIIISLLFSVWVWYDLDSKSAKEYLTGFLVEKSLAIDNIFVISLIFKFFAVPERYQHRILFFGIIGVIILRAILIGLGATIVEKFDWMLYIFGLFLIITGIKMLFVKNKTTDFNKNKFLNFIRNNFRITDEFHGKKFFVLQKNQIGLNQIYCTPLFLALVMIEFMDLIFALDSIPAIFAITTDTYIVYTSNIFAILGLRSMYFIIVPMVHKFKYLKYSIAMITIFIGSKIYIADIFDIEKFPANISLAVTLGLLLVGILCSLYKIKKLQV